MNACTKKHRTVIRSLLALSVMIPLLHGCASADPPPESIRFGVCADVHKDPPQSGYARYIGAEQQQWLRRELENTTLPTVVFSHQSLEDPGGIANGEAIRRILEEANQAAGRKKVVACFSGHHHIDYSREINGIHYIQINSMSYFWVGGDYQHVRYSKEIDRDYPWIKYTVPYKDPLFALVTLGSDGTIQIEGTQSEWVGPSPWDIGYPADRKDRIVPHISTRRLEAAAK